jgi:hypothetical protein
MTSKNKKAKTTTQPQPLPLLPLTDASDKAAFWPNWVTEQVKQGDVDPVRTAYVALPVHRRNNVKRKWETAMHEEEIDMKDDEREKWLQDVKEVKPHGGLIVSIEWSRSSDGALEKYHFPNSEVAAKALSDWLTQHVKTHAHIQCDEFPLNKYDFETCFQVVSKGVKIEFWHKTQLRQSPNLRTQQRIMCISFEHDPKMDTAIADCVCSSCTEAKPKKKSKKSKQNVQNQHIDWLVRDNNDWDR